MKNLSRRSPERATTKPMPTGFRKRQDVSSTDADRAESWPAEREDSGAYERVFDQLPLPAWIVDRATLRFMAVNEACVTHFGFSSHAFLGMLYTDLHRPEDVLDVRQRLGHHAPSHGIHTWRQRKSWAAAVLL